MFKKEKLGYSKVVLSKKQAKEDNKIIDMLMTIKGSYMRKNFLNGKITIFVPKSKPNPNLSGKGVELIWKNSFSGIYHK